MSDLLEQSRACLGLNIVIIYHALHCPSPRFNLFSG